MGGDVGFQNANLDSGFKLIPAGCTGRLGTQWLTIENTEFKAGPVGPKSPVGEI